MFRDAEKRLSVPLRRVGKKGEGVFEPVSWDAALADIAARLKKINDPRTIYHTHYTGTLSMIAGGFPGRFFNRLGATEVDPDTVCNKAGHVVLADMFGTSLSGFDPEQIANARCLMVWGANPSHSAPHMHSGWVKSTGAALVVVDPIATGTARLADIHLQLRPGSDAALAFGLLHVIKKAGLFDRTFIEKHVLGFEDVEAEIDAATLERTAALTGVDAALIEKAALVFAQGAFAALARPGRAAPAEGRQCLPRPAAAQHRHRAIGQARRRLLLHERERNPRRGCRLHRGHRTPRLRQPHGSGR